MTTANCPRCCEQVSVPNDASREATVQCPLCQEEYVLGEALAQLPPRLIVLADAGAADMAPVGSAHVPESLLADEDDTPWTSLNVESDDTEDVVLAPINDGPAAAPFDFAGGSSGGGSKPTAAIRPSSRSRKPKGSPIKSVLSIVIGGLMAFPIAQLILWYLPGDLKRDFGAGPIVAQYIPAIVPTKFRGDAQPDTSTDGPGVQNSSSSIPDFNFGGTGEFAGDATNASTANRDNGNSNKRKKKQPKDQDGFPGTGDSEPEESMTVEDAAAAGADIFGGEVELPSFEATDLPAIDVVTEPAPQSPNEPMIESPLEEPTVTPAESPADSTPETPVPLPSFEDSTAVADLPAAEVSGLAVGIARNAPTVAAKQVVAAFQEALEGNLAWDTDTSGTPSNELKLQFYLAFSKLGEALTFAVPEDETVANQIAETNRLLTEVGKQKDKLAVVSGVATNWVAWGNAKRGTDGICVFGTVKSVKPIGELFETVLTTKGKPIAVVSTSDPTDHFATGREVLVLGTILEDPTENLGGYKGKQSVVVLDGYHVAVAKE